MPTMSLSEGALAKLVELMLQERAPDILLGFDFKPADFILHLRPDAAVPGGLAISVTMDPINPKDVSGHSELGERGAYEKRLRDWLISGDTGISSEIIFGVMTGNRTKNVRDYYNWPKDNSDFGRCHRLLERFPEWKGRLHEVYAVWPAWQPMIRCWDQLEALWQEEAGNPTGKGPKLYALMDQLGKGCQLLEELNRKAKGA